jgi:phage terminase large subunit-like protein
MLLQALHNDDGLEVVEMRQGYRSVNDPAKELRRLVVQRKVRHGGNPVLRLMVENAVVTTDPAGNIKLDKKRCRGVIDGLQAVINALALPISGKFGESKASVYMSRGIEWL